MVKNRWNFLADAAAAAAKLLKNVKCGNRFLLMHDPFRVPHL